MEVGIFLAVIILVLLTSQLIAMLGLELFLILAGVGVVTILVYRGLFLQQILPTLQKSRKHYSRLGEQLFTTFSSQGK